MFVKTPAPRLVNSAYKDMESPLSSFSPENEITLLKIKPSVYCREERTTRFLARQYLSRMDKAGW